MDIPNDIAISDIHSLNRKEALDFLAQITRIEKKTFPANEALPFGEELWRRKPNTRVLYMTRRAASSAVAAATGGARSQPHGNVRSPVIAYAVYIRQKGTALLHKVCVAEPYRRQGLGQKLMDYIRQRLEREGCQYVQLWVDKARIPARALYARCGYDDREEVLDYYAPGRTGVRMVLDLCSG